MPRGSKADVAVLFEPIEDGCFVHEPAVGEVPERFIRLHGEQIFPIAGKKTTESQAGGFVGQWNFASRGKLGGLSLGCGGRIGGEEIFGATGAGFEQAGVLARERNGFLTVRAGEIEEVVVGHHDGGRVKDEG